MKKILIACEESQAVTIEFRKLGFESYSCDILPCSGGRPEWHKQEDVISHLFYNKYDMVIAFPPCTHLAVSGARHFEQKRKDGRQKEGIDFFNFFTKLDCEKVVIENPIGIMSGLYRKPDQIIQPFQFGDKAQKSTCLWLKGVPKLNHTEIVEKGEFWEHTRENGKKIKMPMWYYKALQDAKTPEQRRTLRSKTFPGIAKAMAEQWGSYLLNEIKTTLF